MLGKCYKEFLVLLVLSLMLLYSVCNNLQVSLLPHSLSGLKYPIIIKEMEMVKSQQEKQRLRRSRIKQFKGPFTIEKCFIEDISKRSQTDFYCGPLNYKITRMKSLFPVMQKLKKTKQYLY